MTGHISSEKRIDGRHVLAILIGFFLVVATVNGIMVWMAESSFPGLVTANPYEKGLDYNDRLAARQAQAKLGWQVDVGLNGADMAHRLEARFRDAAGAPLTGMNVRARLIRPVVAGSDFEVALKELDAGLYSASVQFPNRGDWHLVVEARQTGDVPVWRMERELWLK